MEEDWDMCESILEFSEKDPEEEKWEDPTDATEEETENKGVTKYNTNVSETDSFIEVTDDGKADATKKPDAEPKDEETQSAKPKALSRKSPDCLYHGASYRSWFQQLLNLIRGPRFFPDKYVNRVRPVVCSCNTSQGKSSGRSMPTPIKVFINFIDRDGKFWQNLGLSSPTKNPVSNTEVSLSN